MIFLIYEIFCVILFLLYTYGKFIDFELSMYGKREIDYEK